MSQETAPGYIDSSSGKSYDTFLSGKVYVPGETPVTLFFLATLFLLLALFFT